MTEQDVWIPGDRVEIHVFGRFVDTGTVMNNDGTTCLIKQDTIGSTKPFYHDQLRMSGD